MTAPDKLKQLIIFRATGVKYETSEEINGCFDELDGELHDAVCEIRSGTYGTDIPSEWSRHYESKSVAAQMLDGSWVGWTYWFGGGKHGEPESMPWIEDAYDLEMTEVVEVVKKFTKKERVATSDNAP